jgi:hypothetical protein
MLQDLLNGFLWRQLRGINPGSDARHRCTQCLIKILCSDFSLRRLWALEISLLNDIYLWSEHYQREGKTLQFLLELLPTIPQDNVIEHHGESCLKKRLPKQTHILEAQSELLCSLSRRLTWLTGPLPTRDDHLLQLIGLDMCPWYKVLCEETGSG